MLMSKNVNNDVSKDSPIPLCSTSTLSDQLGDRHDCPLKIEVSEQYI